MLWHEHTLPTEVFRLSYSLHVSCSLVMHYLTVPWCYEKGDSAALCFINTPGSSLAACTLLLPILIMCTLLFMLIDCHHSCWMALSHFLIIFPICEDHFEVLILYHSLYVSDGVILRFYKHNHFTQMLNNTRVRMCSLAISLDGAGICYLTVIPKAC